MNTLTIAGTNYPVKYGRKALIEVMKMTGAQGLAELTKLDSLSPQKWGDFVLAGLENGCKLQGNEPPSLEDVNNHLDEHPADFMACIAWLGADITPPEGPDTEGN